jgi:hypothetical protein
MRRLLELRDTRSVFLRDQISCNRGGVGFSGPTSHGVAGTPKSLYGWFYCTYEGTYGEHDTRDFKERSPPSSRTCIYFRRNRTHCTHMYHPKLTSTRNSRPDSRTKPARNRTGPGRARKVQTRRTRNVRQKYSDSPLVPTKLVPMAVTSAQISLHKSVSTSLLLVPAPVTST